MRVKDVATILAGPALVAALGVATAANAYVVIPHTAYAGLAGDANSGTDAFGNPWLWNKTTLAAGPSSPGPGYSAWGTPGLGQNNATYKGSVPADAFSISFVVDDSGATFNQTPSNGGYDDWTRMIVNGVEWTPKFLDNNNEVDFFAPAGVYVQPGQPFFVNVIFNQTNVSGVNSAGKDVGFSAEWETSVPEASTWAMMILGVAAVGAALRHSRRRDATPSLSA